MATPDLPVGSGGSAVTRVEVEGVGFLWTGMLVWGHKPYGSDPISWTCERCGALTVDARLHATDHIRSDRLRMRILARLGIPEREVG